MKGSEHTEFTQEEVADSNELSLANRYKVGPQGVWRYVKRKTTDEVGWSTTEIVGTVELEVREDIMIVKTASTRTYHLVGGCGYAPERHSSSAGDVFPFSAEYLRHWHTEFCKTCRRKLRERFIDEQQAAHFEEEWEWVNEDEHCQICGLDSAEIRYDQLTACVYCGQILYERGYHDVDLLGY